MTTGKRVDSIEAVAFRVNCREILRRTNMPERWLATLLGYAKGSGLHMALHGDTNYPSKEVALRAAQLLRSLVAHQEER